jgi:arylsulfatase A-like enzyme
MLMTGQSLWRIPVGRDAKPGPGTPVLPAALKAAGYVTFRTGKRGNTCAFANAAFDSNTNDGDKREPDSSRRHADRVIAFLKGRDRQRPFFVCASFDKPHDPRRARPEFAALYDPQAVPLPPNFMPEHPFDNGELRIRDEMLAPFPRTPEVIRRHIADYWACVSDLDHEVGRILRTLHETGQADQTIVVFSSDQGLAIGSHGLMGKQNLYEHFKSPLVVAGPGIAQGRSDALVYLFDLFPTFCEWAGAAVPAAVEGRSLAPLARGQTPAWRQTLGGAYRDCQRMVRDGRWKLLWYPKIGKFTLFDLSADPFELKDLAGAPAEAETLARMKRALAAWQEAFGDPGPRVEA